MPSLHGLDDYLQVGGLLVITVGEMHSDRITEPAVDFLESEAFRLWEEKPHHDEGAAIQENEEEVEFPADMFKT